jgi:hypothetical protein
LLAGQLLINQCMIGLVSNQQRGNFMRVVISRDID